MKRIPAIIALAAIVLTGRLGAAVVREDFTADPAGRGWNVQGDASLFAWDAMRGQLGVTWDSSRPNSFFWQALNTVVARTDDCRFAFTILLDEVQVEPGQGTFQLAVGFLRRADAFGTNSFRGAGVNPAWGSRNLLEFDYFPASEAITPTFSAVAVDATNVRWAMANLFPLELTPGVPHRVEIEYTATNQTIRLTVKRNGEVHGQGTTRLDNRFGDYRLDAFSITSYSGEHQPAGYAGQIRAKGWIDDLEFTVPDPPVPVLDIHRTPDGLHLGTRVIPYWEPRVERSADFVNWTALDVPPLTSDATWTYRDPAPPEANAVYRMRFVRP